MNSGEAIILVLHLVVSFLMAGIGIPLALRRVPPNSLYGFRTTTTLQDPKVWYSANRSTGLWLIITGVAVAGTALGTFFAGLGLPAAPLINLMPLILGLFAMIVHGTFICRRESGD
jgi:uncharacterized membrane protein